MSDELGRALQQLVLRDGREVRLALDVQRLGVRVTVAKGWPEPGHVQALAMGGTLTDPAQLAQLLLQLDDELRRP